MIAISGTLYRFCANLLRSVIQDWCIQHNKILDTQYGFYPGRCSSSSFDNVKHAAQNMHLLASNKLMIVFQETSRGAIYTVARCLTISCPSLKTRMMLMKHRLLDGDKIASVQPSFGV